MKNQGILIKIVNKKGFYQEFKKRHEALRYICGYKGYISQIKKQYFSKIDGSFMESQWIKDGYAKAEGLGNVWLNSHIIINAQEGLDDESLAGTLWEEALSLEPHDHEIIITNISSPDHQRQDNLELPPTTTYLFVSDAGCLAVESPDFEYFLQTKIIQIPLKFGSDGVNSLKFCDEPKIVDYWNYGFEQIVERIKINKIFAGDCPDRHTDFLEFKNNEYSIWANPDTRVVLLKKLGR